ncbi:MAG: DUF5009 domain-containing protein, partial [Planctomycetota bacterium]|nr:DUF5009 domain-containing protein [Planctomycetota bacterium]
MNASPSSSAVPVVGSAAGSDGRAAEGVAAAFQNAQSTPRLRCLDLFRGFDIIAMLMVNCSVGKAEGLFPRQFFHVQIWSEGKGATFCDLVFPWFLFIMGVGVPFSLRGGRGKDKSTLTIILQAVRRCLVLMLLGALIHAARDARGDQATNWPWSILGWDILPFLGWAYLVCVLLSLLPRAVQVAFVVAMLVMKVLMLAVVNYPGETQVVWEQKKNLEIYASEQFGAWLSQFMSEANAKFWAGWSRGFFNILPGAALTLMGAWCGEVLRSATAEPRAKTAWIGVAGMVATVLAYAIEPWLGFSKDFFTTSYILLAAGTGAMILALMHQVFEVWRFSGWGLVALGGGIGLGWLSLQHVRLTGESFHLSTWVTFGLMAAIGTVGSLWSLGARFGGPAIKDLG